MPCWLHHDFPAWLGTVTNQARLLFFLSSFLLESLRLFSLFTAARID